MSAFLSVVLLNTGKTDKKTEPVSSKNSDAASSSSDRVLLEVGGRDISEPVGGPHYNRLLRDCCHQAESFPRKGQ